MDTLYAGMEEITQRLTRWMFRDYLVMILGPSPFVPKWPLTRKDAETTADQILAYMDEHPSEAGKIMREMYEP